jgi:hypothetical protein
LAALVAGACPAGGFAAAVAGACPAGGFAAAAAAQATDTDNRAVTTTTRCRRDRTTAVSHLLIGKGMNRPYARSPAVSSDRDENCGRCAVFEPAPVKRGFTAQPGRTPPTGGGAEQNAGLGPGRARLRIDADALYPPEIDHHPRVANGQSWVAVAAASKRDRKSLLPCEPHRGDHVGDAGAPRDQRRPAIDRAVPDLALVVVGGVPGADQLTAKGAVELA